MECLVVAFIIVVGGGGIYYSRRIKKPVQLLSGEEAPKVMVSAPVKPASTLVRHVNPPVKSAPDKLLRFPNLRYSIEDGFIIIGGDFFPQISRSPDRAYLSASVDGYNENGKLALVNLSTRQVLWICSVPRPHEALVTNDGLVLVQDWGERGELNGSFVAFDVNGNQLWKHDFDANVLDSGVSRSGARSFVSTANGRDRVDASSTFLYDNATGRLIYKSNMVGDLKFIGDDLALVVSAPGGGKKSFKLTEDGELPSSYERYLMNADFLHAKKDPAEAIRFLRRERSKEKPDWKRFEAVLNAALNKSEGLDDGDLGMIFRFQGEFFEEKNELESAVYAWRRALELNERVGVKTRLKRLEKEIGLD